MSQTLRTGVGRMPLGVHKTFFQKKTGPPVFVLPAVLGCRVK
jgi:hypothetical protein